MDVGRGGVAAEASRTAVGAGSSVPRRFWSRDVRATPSFLLLYLAVGLLLAEAAAGIVLVGGGASLLRPGATTGTAGAAPVPTGVPDLFTLEARVTGYVGVNGTVNGVPVGGLAGVRDPTLHVGWGDHVTLVLVDGENMQHDLHLDGYGLQTGWVTAIGESSAIDFRATQQGAFDYYCTVPGHRENGMQGLLIVGAATHPIGPEANLTTPWIAHSPTEIPPPVTRNYSTTVNVTLVAEEETAEIEPGVSYTYWTYNGTVPGPFLRVRVNDTVAVHFYNSPTSGMTHSIDFHAATGPGGGAAVDQTPPGRWSNFSFLARVPGLFVYHCGTPNIPTHIANGMFGMILVQPAHGLPPVDEEFYLMESELYLDWPIHTLGDQRFNGTALLDDQPTYVVFNGRYDAFTGPHALHAAVNDTVRVYFGDIGPNDFAAFHIIGTTLGDVWPNGDLVDPPSHGVQTVPVAPGDALVADVPMVYPGNYTIVDHSIVNAIDKGALAVLNVSGWANRTIFHADLGFGGIGPASGLDGSPTAAPATATGSAPVAAACWRGPFGPSSGGGRNV